MTGMFVTSSLKSGMCDAKSMMKDGSRNCEHLSFGKGARSQCSLVRESPRASGKGAVSFRG